LVPIDKANLAPEARETPGTTGNDAAESRPCLAENNAPGNSGSCFHQRQEFGHVHEGPTTVRSAMTPTIHTISPRDSAQSAARLITETAVGLLPVEHTPVEQALHENRHHPDLARKAFLEAALAAGPR
jgi:hypothetical protein